MLEIQSKELDIHTNNFIVMERKLATVKKITNIRPIEGADMIELATVGGWNVVVGKDVGQVLKTLAEKNGVNIIASAQIKNIKS